MRLIQALSIKISSIALFMLFSNNAMALQSDFNEIVTISANKQITEINKNKMSFLDDVVITQGTISIKANKVEVLRNDKGEIKQVTAWGTPATYEQMMENNRPIHAEGKILEYLPPKQTIIIKQNAQITQENSTLTGETITYDIVNEKMEASGDKTSKNNGRVITKFVPDNLKSQINDSKSSNK